MLRLHMDPHSHPWSTSPLLRENGRGKMLGDPGNDVDSAGGLLRKGGTFFATKDLSSVPSTGVKGLGVAVLAYNPPQR